MKAIERITNAIEHRDGVTIVIDDIEITAEKITEDPGIRPAYYVIFRHSFPATVSHYDALEGMLAAMREIAPFNRWSVQRLTYPGLSYNDRTGQWSIR